MNHQFCKNDVGIPIIEIFENDNVWIARFINGDTEIEFKPDCDKKVIEMYKQLMKPLRKGD